MFNKSELEQHLTAKQAAPLLGYKPGPAFTRAVRRYNIPHVVLNSRHWLFNPRDLSDWLKSRKVGGQRNG